MRALRCWARQKQLFLWPVCGTSWRWGWSTVISAAILIEERRVVPIVKARLPVQTGIRVIRILRAWSPVLDWRDMSISPLFICSEGHLRGRTRRRAVGLNVWRLSLVERFSWDWGPKEDGLRSVARSQTSLLKQRLATFAEPPARVIHQSQASSTPSARPVLCAQRAASFRYSSPSWCGARYGVVVLSRSWFRGR
jgi:hypothetical protein